MIRNLSFFTAVTAFALLVAPGAFAEKKTKSTQSEANWVKFDPEAKTVTLKIRKPGKGPNKKMVKKKQEIPFRVTPEGSVLKRTTVTVNGQRAEMADIPEGKQVLVYWVPDPENEGGFYAKKIDAIMSEEEFDAKYGKGD